MPFAEYLRVPDGYLVQPLTTAAAPLVSFLWTSQIKSLAVPALAPSYVLDVTGFLGVRVVEVDVDPQTGCVAVAQLEEAGHFDAVLATCPGGSVPRLNELSDFCDYRAVPLVLEATPVFGAPLPYHLLDAVIYEFPLNYGVLVTRCCTPFPSCFGGEAEPHVLEYVSEELRRLTEWCSLREALVSCYTEELLRFIPKSTLDDCYRRSVPLRMNSKHFAIVLGELLVQEGVPYRTLSLLWELPNAVSFADRTVEVLISRETTTAVCGKVVSLCQKI